MARLSPSPTATTGVCCAWDQTMHKLPYTLSDQSMPSCTLKPWAISCLAVSNKITRRPRLASMLPRGAHPDSHFLRGHVGPWQLALTCVSTPLRTASPSRPPENNSPTSTLMLAPHPTPPPSGCKVPGTPLASKLHAVVEHVGQLLNIP